ncbi:MAG: flagellar hook capping FlgD N-terminal domain-containing protein [Phycisphaerae bacterium]
MDPINETSLLSPLSGADAANSFADMGSEDFLKLLIMQLRNQDPLEPVGNEELLRQISSIREIELSTTLTDSLRALTGQQHFASASSLIGQYVTGLPGEDGAAVSGIVVGVRFADEGRAILRLADGSEMPLEQVSTIEPPLRAAEALIGQAVIGLDRRDPANPEVVEGIATGVRVDTSGEVLLELDTGQDLRFRDIVSVAAAEAV